MYPSPPHFSIYNTLSPPLNTDTRTLKLDAILPLNFCPKTNKVATIMRRGRGGSEG